jgi:hypothetical protein
MPRITVRNDMGLMLALGIILIWLAGIVGWVLNIISIATGTFTPLTPLMVLRLIGIFVAPLGSVLGYC